MMRKTILGVAGWLLVAALVGPGAAAAQVTDGEGHPLGYYGHGTFGDTHPELRDPWNHPVNGWFHFLGGSAWSYHPSPYYYSQGMFTYNPWAGGSTLLQPGGATQGTVVQLDPWYVRRDPWWIRHPNDPLSIRYRAMLEAERKRRQPPAEAPPNAEAPAPVDKPVVPAAQKTPAPVPRPATRPPDPAGRELLLVGVGDEMLKKGQFESAETVYAKAAAESPGSPVVPFALAHARIALGKVREAAAGLREGFARNPEWGREGLDLPSMLPKDTKALEACLQKALEAGDDGRLVRAYVRFASKAYDEALDEAAALKEEPAARRIEASVRSLRETPAEPPEGRPAAPAAPPAEAPAAPAKTPEPPAPAPSPGSPP